jgi:predicted phage-related endonuclease|tara:strand:- start:1435 stop:2406 length:972 start_codon:yes stop_codon:yes gene_type:complete
MNQEERKAWLEERKKGLGGTDVASIMLASSNMEDRVGCFDRSLFKLWSEKTGCFETEDSDNQFLMRGRVMEKYVCELYELHLGEGCRLWEKGLTWHSTRPRIFGTPDRMVEHNGAVFGMDAKTRRMRKGWGKSGTTDIPLDVEVQMRAYMEIFDAPCWDIATLFGLDDFRVYRLERDKELGGQILDVAEQWWDSYVETQTPPPVDGTDLCRQTLGKLNPRVKDDVLRTASVAERDIYEKIISIRDQHKQINEKKNELENQLRNCIGDSLGISGIATWKPTKPRQIFDKKRFSSDHPDLYQKYVTEGSSNRVLRIMEPKNDDSY